MRILEYNNIDDFENTIPNRPTEYAWQVDRFIIELHGFPASVISNSPSHFGALYEEEIEHNSYDGPLCIIVITEG